MKNIVHLCDCMNFMQRIPDKFYDLAIVDPPYGIFKKIKNSKFFNSSYKDMTEINGWEVECESPLEIRFTEGEGFASGEAAFFILQFLKVLKKEGRRDNEQKA